LSYANEAHFPKKGDRYNAQITVNGVPFDILPDTGADLVLLTDKEGARLGIDLRMVRDNLHVQGIKGAPGDFKIVPCWVQIGNLEPIQAPVGIASDSEALEESLLGDKGILDSGISATYDQSGVTYRKVTVAGAYRGGGGVSF